MPCRYLAAVGHIAIPVYLALDGDQLSVWIDDTRAISAILQCSVKCIRGILVCDAGREGGSGGAMKRNRKNAMALAI